MNPEMTIERRMCSERGITLIHVAVAIFVLTGFGAFVLDQGVMMLARGQAQNVADMAAIGGATARALDEPSIDVVPPANGITEQVITESVNGQVVFGGVGANTGRAWSWNCPAGAGGDDWCVRVDVFRDGTNNSTTLPVYFAPLLGVTYQKVRATATAVARPANGSRCMKPWLIPDKWQNKIGPPETFDMGDQYAPFDYGKGASGTGYVHQDFGTTMTLTPGDPLQPLRFNNYYELAGATEDSMTSCQLQRVIGQHVNIVSPPGPSTLSGLDLLLANGPVWVVAGLFRPDEFKLLDPNLPLHVTIENLIGLRITARNGNDIEAVMVPGIGDLITGGLTPGNKGSMIKKIELVR